MSYKAALVCPLEDKTAQEKREEVMNLVAEMRQRNIHIAKYRATYTRKCAMLTQHRNMLTDNLRSYGGIRDADNLTSNDKETESYRSNDNDDSFIYLGSLMAQSEKSGLNML